MTRKQVMARLAEVQQAGATDLYPARVRELRAGRYAGWFEFVAPWSYDGWLVGWQKLVASAFPEATRQASGLRHYPTCSADVAYLYFDEAA